METPYPGIYRAKALGWRPGVLTALVPQVFGDITIEITQFTGEAPQVAEMGWVHFESGDPEHPVWSSKVAGGGLDGLADVDTTTMPPTDGQGLMWDADLGQWVPGSPITDHGALTGLADDDHPQYLTSAEADTAYVNTAGDTMTGALIVPTPTAGGHATTKDYVDSRGSIQIVTALPGTLTPNVLYVVV